MPCLVAGSKPASQLLLNINRQTYETPVTIYLDLNRRKASFKSLNLPNEFGQLEKNQKKELAYDRVSTYVASEIEAHLTGEMDFNEEAENLFDFFWENNRELLMPQATFKPAEVEDKKKVLQIIQSQKRIPFLFVCLKFYALSQRVKNLIIVIDNCDQKDQILIEAFIDTLCHLDHCFENIKGSYDFLPRLTSIISCRPATRSMLENAKAHSAFGSHGAKIISIEAPCSLSELVKQRVIRMEKGSSFNEVEITSRNGMLWTFMRSEQFLNKLSESLESNRHGTLLLALCNWNVADGLSALAEVLSNRHFVDWDRIIADVVPEEGVPEAGFSKNTILRALAYGNSGGDPVYPTRRTRIPNIISGEKSVFPKTFIKPRILQLLLTRSQKSHAFWHLSELTNFATDFFGKPEKDTLLILDEMYYQGLVDTNWGYEPSSKHAGCEIFATPRASCLWDEFKDSNFLLGFYRDDLELTSRHQCIRVPTYQLDLTQRCSEDLAFLQDSLEGELRELQLIASRSKIVEFLDLFENTFFSEIIFSGVGVAVFTFYRKYLRNFHSLGIEAKYKHISESLITEKQKLFNGR